VPPHAVVPTTLTTGAFRGSDAVRAGLLTWRQLRGSSWHRLFQDVYLHASQPITHESRARAATLRLPAGVVTGASAAVLWGVDLRGPDDDVEVTLPPGSNMVRVAGIRARRARIDADRVWRRRDVPVTTPAATALRLAQDLPCEDAVVAIDQLIHTGVVDLEPVRMLAAAATGPGSVRARRVCSLADGRAESPQETRLRLMMIRGGLPTPVPQFVVRIDGRFVARVDFAWPDRKVAVEYDGLWHAEAGQFARDRRRLNSLHAAGWRIVFVTAPDMHQEDHLVNRLATALR
jgi:hypothetical protein